MRCGDVDAKGLGAGKETWETRQAFGNWTGLDTEGPLQWNAR